MDWILGQLDGLWAATVNLFAFDVSMLARWDVIARLLLQCGLFMMSAFFSGSETALFSLSRLDLQKLRRDRHPQTDNLHALLDQPRRLIISILCGNELVNIAATANLAGLMVTLYDPERAGIINVVVMFPLILLFGEVTPKTIAVTNPVRISSGLVAAPLTMWVKLVTPLREVIRVVADRVTTMIAGEARGRENLLGADEFKVLVEEVTAEGVLDATERVLIDHLLEAGETEIVSIMTPRTRVGFIYSGTPVAEVVEYVRKIKHPRIPVCQNQRDNLLGFIHAEDIMRLVLDKVNLDKLTLDELLHAPVIVPPTKTVDEMFDFFQTHRARAAMVINEFGGVEGMVTMRDVINFIFSEISDGVKGQDLYREQDNDVYEVDGMMKLNDFNDLSTFGLNDPRMTTVGGVVFRYFDRLPKEGDSVALMDGLRATVLQMDVHRVARVRIERTARRKEAEEEAPAEPETEQPTVGGTPGTEGEAK